MTGLYGSNPKLELRGAWLQTVYQDGYARRGTTANKKYLTQVLDRLHNAGINAVFFQVRPSADAFYCSDIEPWSKFLTGQTGIAPSPKWDPLAFMIDECHKRGMELHAWLNPYRATTSAAEKLPKGHIYHKHPERFVRYGKKLYFDPGIPENRTYIERVVADIVSRYDVDGIHFDDYFYPYPVKGVQFPDGKSYAKYGKGKQRGDWRRENVNKLIEGVHGTITKLKPWVRFGVSPFGIWRNAKTDPHGSESSGLQNYDDLFADIQLWARNGWIDYQMPQLYWEIGHRAACYEKLLKWWNANTHQRHLYIGQDIARIIKHNQLNDKMTQARAAANVHGNVWWYGYSLADNNGAIADSLSAGFHSTTALVPAYPWISQAIPNAVTGIRQKAGTITWDTDTNAHPDSPDAVNHWVIYRFNNKKDIDLSRSDAIEAVVYTPEYKPMAAGVYVVTALSRINQESAPSSPVTIRL